MCIRGPVVKISSFDASLNRVYSFAGRQFQLLLAMIVEMESMEVSQERRREIDFFPPSVSSVIGREFMICLMALNSTGNITFF